MAKILVTTSFAKAFWLTDGQKVHGCSIKNFLVSLLEKNYIYHFDFSYPYQWSIIMQRTYTTYLIIANFDLLGK